MGRLNKRFYSLYVPVTLGTVTINGTIPCSKSSRFVFALRFEQSTNISLLKVPRIRSDSSYQPRDEFWKSLTWKNDYQLTKYKGARKRIKKLGKAFDFGKASWSSFVSVEFYTNSVPVV